MPELRIDTVLVGNGPRQRDDWKELLLMAIMPEHSGLGPAVELVIVPPSRLRAADTVHLPVNDVDRHGLTSAA